MKLPDRFRRLTRRGLGLGRAAPIAPEALRDLAAREPVVVIGVGIVTPGATDPALPGEQRTASLLSLGTVVDDVPRQRAIVLHCG